MLIPDYLIGVTWFSVLLIIGLFASLISIKLKLPDVLLLLIIGLITGYYLKFPYYDFFSALAIFALVMILFDSTSKFKIKAIRQQSPDALKLSLVFLLFSLIFLTFFTYLFFTKSFFDLKMLLIALTFAALMSSTSPDSVLAIFQGKRTKISEILEFESILNTPLAVLIPLIVIGLLNGDSFQTNIIFTQLAQGIMTGAGVGLVLGLLIFELMRRKFIEHISPLAVIATALFSFVLAENIGGNGVLAVTTLGVLFGIYEIKKKLEIQNFVDIFTVFLKIVIFILLGLIIKFPTDKIFLIKTIILFGIFIYIRYLAVSVSFYKSTFTKREKWFMALTGSKGLAVAVVAFTLISYNIPGLEQITELTVLFILYSIIVASITSKFSNYFLTKKEIKIK